MSASSSSDKTLTFLASAALLGPLVGSLVSLSIKRQQQLPSYDWQRCEHFQLIWQTKSAFKLRIRPLTWATAAASGAFFFCFFSFVSIFARCALHLMNLNRSCCRLTMSDIIGSRVNNRTFVAYCYQRLL